VQFARTNLDNVNLMNESPDNCGLNGRGGFSCQNCQIGEGSIQTQRVVGSKHLRK